MAYAHMKEAANCYDLTPATAIRSFCLNSDLLGAIAQGTLKGAYVDTVWPRYQTYKHHRSVAFRAWRPFNFNEVGIGGERLWHMLPA
jgi:hypothetical protein